MNTEGHDCGQSNDEVELSLADKWIISRLQQVEAEVTEQIESYRFDQMAQTLYSFVWDEYCSWYVELTKVVLSDENATQEQLRGTRRTLVRVLEATLRLLHPIMPFISEELWQNVRPLVNSSEDTIMNCQFPVPDSDIVDQDAIDEMTWVQAVITGVRNVRGEMNISPAKALPILFEGANENALTWMRDNQAYLLKFGRFESMKVVKSSDELPESATALVGEMRILIPLGSFIDASAEIQRLNKELEKAEKAIQGVAGRLGNKSFVDKAPEAVLNKAKQQLSDAEKTKALLLEQVERMQQFLES